MEETTKFLKWYLRAYVFSYRAYKEALGKFQMWVRTQEPEKTRYIA